MESLSPYHIDSCISIVMLFLHTKIGNHLGSHHRHMDKENVVIIHNGNLLNVKTNEIVVFSEKKGHIGENILKLFNDLETVLQDFICR